MKPKFKIGQNIWIVFRHQVKPFKICGVVFDEEFKNFRYTLKGLAHNFYKTEENVFAVKEDAQAKLKELGENK